MCLLHSHSHIEPRERWEKREKSSFPWKMRRDEKSFSSFLSFHRERKITGSSSLFLSLLLIYTPVPVKSSRHHHHLRRSLWRERVLWRMMRCRGEKTKENLPSILLPSYYYSLDRRRPFCPSRFSSWASSPPTHSSPGNHHYRHHLLSSACISLLYMSHKVSLVKA